MALRFDSASLSRRCSAFASASGFITPSTPSAFSFATPAYACAKSAPKSTHAVSPSVSKSGAKTEEATGYILGKATANRRVYVGDKRLHVGMELTLSPTERSHLRAARIRPGTRLFALSSRGELARATVLDHCSSLRIESMPSSSSSCSTFHNRSHARIRIALGLLHRPSRLDWAVEKLCELGVHSLLVADCHRCTTRYSSCQKRRPRWTRLATAAAKQRVGSAPPLCIACVRKGALVKTVSAAVRRNEHVFVLSGLSGAVPLIMAAASIDGMMERQRDVLLVIGPEGGLTEEEESELVNAGAKRASLGEFRLRAETAAVVAAGVIAQMHLASQVERAF